MIRQIYREKERAMFKRFGICALATAALLLTGTRVHADAAGDIKENAKKLTNAITDGDAATAKKYALTDEKSDKLLDMVCELTKSNKKLVDAAVSKFGDAGNQISAGGNPGMRKPQVMQSIDNAKVEVDGDTAVATPDSGKPSKWKKDSGKWKVDMTNMTELSNIDKQGVFFQKLSEANQKSAQEISDGKYKTLDEAKAGVRANMMAALQSVIPGR
jgi:hypothetical protein